MSELEGMLLEKEAALQKVVHPGGADPAQRIDELERERRVCYVEVRRLRQLLAEGGGGQGGDGDRPRQTVAAGGDAVGGGGGTAELRQLRQVSRCMIESRWCVHLLLAERHGDPMSHQPGGWWQEIQALRLTKAELGEQLEW
eukprot:COSAG01_NODE_8241_length_2859_cov_1.859783_3_plen_142_part_00